MAALGAHDVPGAEVDVVDEDDAVRLEAALRPPGAPVPRLSPERLQRGIPDLRQEVDAVLALRPCQAACMGRLPCSGLAIPLAARAQALLGPLPLMRCSAAFTPRIVRSAQHLLLYTAVSTVVNNRWPYAGTPAAKPAMCDSAKAQDGGASAWSASSAARRGNKDSLRIERRRGERTPVIMVLGTSNICSRSCKTCSHCPAQALSTFCNVKA